MNRSIEFVDKLRMRYLRWHLIGVALFLLLSVTRFFFRHGGLNSQPIGMAVLLGLTTALLIMAISTVGLALLARSIKDDPALEEALNNELVAALETQSWKAAFLAVVATAVFFALVGFFYPVKDPVLVALTSIVAGAGAYRANFYFRYRSS